MPGRTPVVIDFVVPDEHGRYLTVNEAMNFLSEFIHGSGNFTVQFWDFASMRESDPEWRTVSEFVTNPGYDGHGTDFGVRVGSVAGQNRVEISNVDGNKYLLGDVRFSN